MMKNEAIHPRQRLIDVVPRNAPFSMFIDPCGYCNLKCRFCPCNNSDYRFKERHQMMSLGLFRKIADDIAEFDDVKVINLYGYGEPLMNPHIPDMVHILKQYNLCNEVRIATNGILLTPELNKRLVDGGLDYIRISVNALSAESYQDIVGVPVDYDVFLENIEDLYIKSRGTQLKIAAKLITTDVKSENDLEYFSKTYAPITDYHFMENQHTGWIKFDCENKLMEGAVILSYPRIEDAQKAICSYPFTNMMIFANGKVGVCCSDWRMDTAIGDVTKEKLKYIWEDKMQAFRMAMLSGKRSLMPCCSECLIIPKDDISIGDAELMIARLVGCRGE